MIKNPSWMICQTASAILRPTANCSAAVAAASAASAERTARLAGGGGGGGGGGRGGFGGFGSNAGFDKVIIHDLIPYMDTHYRTIADQRHRAMAGLSMGGMETHTITMANLDTFAYIGFFRRGRINTTQDA